MRFTDHPAGRRDIASARVLRAGSQSISQIGARGSAGLTADAEIWDADGFTGTFRIRPELTHTTETSRIAIATGIASRGSKAVLMPTADASWRVSGVALRASGGRAVRFPTLTELYWEPGGNADLRPESGWSADGGISMSSAHLSVSLGAFVSDMADRIVWQPALVTAGMQVWTPTNVGRARTSGLEGHAEFSASTAAMDLNAGLEFDWIQSSDLSDRAAASYGRPLRYQPTRTVAGWMDFAPGAGTANLSVRHVGPRPVASDGSDALPAYTIVDAGLGRAMVLRNYRATVQIEVRNVFNVLHEAVRLYPMPGRATRFTLEISL
jgi:iron complex outermembrane receptor protein